MKTLPKRGRIEETVDAPIDAVWELVSDVTRTGEWSHECVASEWLDGARAAAPGVRFQGRNQQGRSKWSRVCEVVAADAPHRFVFKTIPDRLHRDQTVWTYELEDRDGRTCIVQSFVVTKISWFMDRLYALIVPAHRDRSGALTEDLRRLGAVAASSRVPLS